MEILPSAADVASTLAICGVFPSRIRFRMAGLTIMTSQAATRPVPSALGSSCWDRTACSVMESCILTCLCFSSEKTSTMRSTASAADMVWSVANTRWPVSAAVKAVWMVSWSRISPMRMTSGS